MKRFATILIAALLAALCACGTAGSGGAAAVTEPPAQDARTPEPAATDAPATPTPEPTAPPAPASLVMPAPPEGWADGYLAFLDDNYDIFTALWPEGLTGVGFIDLDLDEMPEMIVFDPGASATMGVQMFDMIDGQVYCVSSVLDSASGAFDDAYFSPVSVCTSFFESFRLSRTEDGVCFWVDSANGAMESGWDEIVRFDSDDGVLTPVSVCSRWLETDPETGLTTAESYFVGGQEADAAAYEAAAAVYRGGADTGYDARGVFLWNDMSRYDTTYDGLMTMAADAAAAYAPIVAD